MIKVESYGIVAGMELQRTYSDAGFYIMRDGEMYAEAVDPVSMGRVYTETDVPIEVPEENPDVEPEVAE